MDSNPNGPNMVGLSGLALLDDPVLKKGKAFTVTERKKRGLEGLLLSSIETIERQLERVMGHLEQKLNDLERYGTCERLWDVFSVSLGLRVWLGVGVG